MAESMNIVSRSLTARPLSRLLSPTETGMRRRSKMGPGLVMSLLRRIKRKLAESLWPVDRHGGSHDQWARIVMNQHTLSLVQDLGPGRLKALEISGSFWEDR